MQRRQFTTQLGLSLAGAMTLGWWPAGLARTENCPPQNSAGADLFFRISLAQWSLHKELFSKKMDNLDFAATARHRFSIEAVEYVNQFFKDKATDKDYLNQMNQRAADNGVRNLLIMIDGEGGLAETDDKTRLKAVENHYKWVEAAARLGCHSIRVNAFSSHSDPYVAADAAVDGLSRLAEFAHPAGINIIVENHGGFSSNGKWLSGVMTRIGKDNAGTLPDFGNFCLRRDNAGGNPWSGPCVEEYDRYTGVAELMPFAKAVSAKSYDFDESGTCIETDFARMLAIVKEVGYTGYIGIEYEGSNLPEDEGIRLTKALMEREGAKLSGK